MPKVEPKWKEFIKDIGVDFTCLKQTMVDDNGKDRIYCKTMKMRCKYVGKEDDCFTYRNCGGEKGKCVACGSKCPEAPPHCCHCVKREEKCEVCSA